MIQIATCRGPFVPLRPAQPTPTRGTPPLKSPFKWTLPRFLIFKTTPFLKQFQSLLMLNTRRNNQPRFVYKGLLIDQLNGILPSDQHQGALFLGSEDALQERKLNRLGIKAVVSAVKILPPMPECIKYHLVVPVEDQESQPLFKFFEQVFKFVQQARKKANVLIHCQAGVSRSATLAIAYVMKKYSWKVATAYDLVKRRRIVACPNFGFCQQLLTYQKSINLSTDWRIEDDKIIYRQQKKREEDKSTTDDPETRESIAFPSGIIKRSKLRQSWI